MKIIFVVIGVLLSHYLFACTTFLLSKNGQYFFGRNYDFVTGNGMVVVNTRNIQKSSNGSEAAKPFSWVSKYGSITFNQFGKDFPQGGMNEKGLVVELMWLDGTQYPKPDERVGLSELHWIQYQLDNCTDVDEVIATDKKVRINADNAAPLHFLVADATGKVATIEFLNGKMVTHRGKELPFSVLTNTTYADALTQKHSSANTSFTDNSVARFATACELLEQFKQAKDTVKPVDYSFHMLEQVAQKGFTKWSIVYDLNNKRIYFSSDQNSERKSISFSEFNFSRSGDPLALNINSNFKGAGSLAFVPLTSDLNKWLIETSAEESKKALQLIKK